MDNKDYFTFENNNATRLIDTIEKLGISRKNGLFKRENGTRKSLGDFSLKADPIEINGSLTFEDYITNKGPNLKNYSLYFSPENELIHANLSYSIRSTRYSFEWDVTEPKVKCTSYSSVSGDRDIPLTIDQENDFFKTINEIMGIIVENIEVS